MIKADMQRVIDELEVEVMKIRTEQREKIKMYRRIDFLLDLIIKQEQAND